MNYKSKYIGIIAILTGITIFGFNVSGSHVAECRKTTDNWGLVTPFVFHVVRQMNGSERAKDDLKFYVRGIYGHTIDQQTVLSLSDNALKDDPATWNIVYSRSVSMSTLLSANTLVDLIPDLPTHWIETYESVWIEATNEKEHITMMSENDVLSPEQKDLLMRANMGTHFVFVINFYNTETLTQKVNHRRINVGLTLVPEKEANYDAGYDQLMKYFENNSTDLFTGLNKDNFNFMRIKFTIAEDGRAESVRITHESGFENIDRYILELVKNMPTWKPAEDGNGNPVKQEFEMIYGTPGC